MVEVIGRVAVHPDALHDRPRPAIGRHRERDDLVETDVVEAERQRAPRRLGCVPVPPMPAREPPTDFHGLPAQRDRRRPEPHVSDERRDVRDLDRPQAPAVSVPLGFDAIDERVASAPSTVAHPGRS